MKKLILLVLVFVSTVGYSEAQLVIKGTSQWHDTYIFPSFVPTFFVYNGDGTLVHNGDGVAITY